MSMSMKQIHEETATVRIYGNPVCKWAINRKTGDIIKSKDVTVHEFRKLMYEPDWHIYYIEYEYTEYRLNGEIKQTGSRDFSYSNRPKRVTIKTWDGVKRWKNGYRSYVDHDILVDDGVSLADLKRVVPFAFPWLAGAEDIKVVR